MITLQDMPDDILEIICKNLKVKDFIECKAGVPILIPQPYLLIIS